MVNNIATTTTILSTTLGATMTFSSDSSITIIAGELGAGLLLFDPDGTLGVISGYVSQNEFVVTTYAVSIDIQTILGLSY